MQVFCFLAADIRIDHTAVRIQRLEGRTRCGQITMTDFFQIRSNAAAESVTIRKDFIRSHHACVLKVCSFIFCRQLHICCCARKKRQPVIDIIFIVGFHFICEGAAVMFIIVFRFYPIILLQPLLERLFCCQVRHSKPRCDDLCFVLVNP